MRGTTTDPTIRHGRIPVDEYGRVISAHEGLVRAVARDYYPPPGTGTDDLLQEGRIGLWKACRDYRPDRGANFRTFAEVCVRRQILSALVAATREKHRAVNTATSMAAPISEDGMTVADTVASPHQLEDLVLWREQAAHALDALAAIPDHYQGPLIDVHVRGLTYAEVVAARGIANRKSLDNLLQRARRATLRAAQEPRRRRRRHIAVYVPRHDRYTSGARTPEEAAIAALARHDGDSELVSITRCAVGPDGRERPDTRGRTSKHTGRPTAAWRVVITTTTLEAA